MSWYRIGCIALATLLTACSQVVDYYTQRRQQRMLEQEIQQADTLAASMRRLIAEKAVKAKILVNAHPYEGAFVMPAKEFAQLKDILSRMEPVIPAIGEPQVVFVSYPAFETLVFVDAEKGEYDLPVLERQWMKKSEAETLLPTRPRRSDEPRWCLPDADYDALMALPTVRQAQTWAKWHSRGTALVVPNAPKPEPTDGGAAAPAAPDAAAPGASS